MKVNLLKINNSNWVVIPLRNTVQEILDIYTNVSIDEFNNLLNENIIKVKIIKLEVKKINQKS